MSTQPEHGSDGGSGRTGAPDAAGNGAGSDRLGPRPLARPQVDPSAAAVFGRPAGVDGAFSPPPGGPASARAAFDAIVATPPPPESLTTAFGRPVGSEGVVLQRPPAQRAAQDETDHDDPLWMVEDADP